MEYSYDSPPWKEASCSSKLVIAFYYFAIYFPVLILFGIFYTVYTCYVILYIYPLIGTESDRPSTYYWDSDAEHEGAKARGWILLVIMTWSIIILSISSIRAILTDPGKIPEEKEWSIVNEEESDNVEIPEPKRTEEAEVGKILKIQHERNKYGQPRTCERCMKRKPDRTHHCRLCDQCVLKMDHHCPWIANCVGYFNYKYFFLMVFYGALSIIIFTTTFWETVYVWIHDPDASAYACFFIVLMYSLVTMLGIVVTGFLSFHIYLITKNMSTIEFCEKKRSGQQSYKEDSPWRISNYHSFQAALGPKPWAWLLPIQTKELDEGLYYDANEELMQLAHAHN